MHRSLLGAHPLNANLQLLESVLLEEVDAASFVHEDFGHLHGLGQRAEYQRESIGLDDVIGVVAFVEADWPFGPWRPRGVAGTVAYTFLRVSS
jgi:hypothetical protein